MIRRVPIKLIAVVLAANYVLPMTAAEVQGAPLKMGQQGTKIYYTKKFDLSGLPPYKPDQRVSGGIRQWGNNYIVNLVRVWEDGFNKYHPDVKFEDHLKTSEAAIPGLYTHVADIGLLGRQILWDELLAYQREFNGPPMEITVCTGSLNAETFALGIFVHKDNPLSKLTMEQLDGIFGAERDGGWNGLVWDTSVARGPKKNIRTWGELGWQGEWADKPIHVYGYNLNYHFVDEFDKKVFHGGKKWNEKLHEYANYRNSEGRLIDSHDQFMADLGKDPYGIAYGVISSTPQTKAVALAGKEAGPYVELNLDNVQNRPYPLIVYIYFSLNRKKGKPLDPRLREFMRYILSREGQEAVMRDGKFLPLTADA